MHAQAKGDQTAGARIMFLGRDRFYYAGLLGRRMTPRTLGACSLYFAPEGRLRIKLAGGDWQARAAAVAPANVSHQIASDCGGIICVGVEPERVAPASLAALAAEVAREDGALARRVAAAHGALSCPRGAADLSAADFDALAFGRALTPRAVDPRIAAALALLDAGSGEAGIAAQDCAAAAGLSTSRFLHLFKAETGASFRRLRMWKRARRFLRHAAPGGSLTDVALDLGYPDSSHFSHSIRKTYGLKPRAIRDGSRELTITAARDYGGAAPG